MPSAAAHGKHGHSLISSEKFRQLYAMALKLQRVGEHGLGWLRGREALLAGVVADLRSGDTVVTDHAGSVDEIARGEMGTSTERPSLEERVIAALGDAVGDRMRKTGRVTAIFLDAAQNGKILQEARSLAIDARLPVLLVEYGNAKKPRAGKKKKPAALEYPSIPVDTQDVIALYRVAHESITRAREGSGPTHIVGVRWQPAVKSGQRAAKVKTEDAVVHLEQWLTARGMPAAEWRREIVAEFKAKSDGQNFNTQNAVGDRAEQRIA
ncbi:MAG TPA: thiamine pyrophosphate-dependent enzyme [Acidobacteriaceae bacterium]|nr:thiamine pyrophosphate-dependent enzyme [Acidobacteriaceae bacterium]